MPETLDPQEVLNLLERIATRDTAINALAQVIDGRNYELRSARAST